MPGRCIPQDLKPKDKLDVFVYRDCEDRLVATPETPLATVGEFAYLKVLSVNQNIGAFLGWSFPRIYCCRFANRNRLCAGDSVIVHIGLDEKTNRIVASTRLNHHLSRDTPAYRNGQAVNLLIVGRTPLGYNAIVDNAHRGLLYHDNLANALLPGQKVKGFVRTVRLNGKIDLSLDASGYKRVAALRNQIVQALEGSGGYQAFDDDSSPETIRQKFGVSKKAFKQALCKPYKERRIRFKNPGIELLDNSSWSPGGAQ